jgi:hypothetical protein
MNGYLNDGQMIDGNPHQTASNDIVSSISSTSNSLINSFHPYGYVMNDSLRRISSTAAIPSFSSSHLYPSTTLHLSNLPLMPFTNGNYHAIMHHNAITLIICNDTNDNDGCTVMGIASPTSTSTPLISNDVHNSHHLSHVSISQPYHRYYAYIAVNNSSIMNGERVTSIWNGGMISSSGMATSMEDNKYHNSTLRRISAIHAHLPNRSYPAYNDSYDGGLIALGSNTVMQVMLNNFTNHATYPSPRWQTRLSHVLSSRWHLLSITSSTIVISIDYC